MRFCFPFSEAVFPNVRRTHTKLLWNILGKTRKSLCMSEWGRWRALKKDIPNKICFWVYCATKQYIFGKCSSHIRSGSNRKLNINHSLFGRYVWDFFFVVVVVVQHINSTALIIWWQKTLFCYTHSMLYVYCDFIYTVHYVVHICGVCAEKSFSDSFKANVL